MSTEENLKQARDLKSQGNDRFARGEFAKALHLYDAAMRLLPDQHKERSALHNNKAACHLKSGRWREAARECTAALKIDPTFTKATLRRAKAFERGGMFAEAVEDYKVVNASELKSTETTSAEEKCTQGLAITQMMAAKSASNNSANSNGNNSNNGNAQRQQQQQQQAGVMLKLVHGDETRAIKLNNYITYAELLELAKSKYPELSSPYRVTFRDADNDLIIIRDKSDVQLAINLALEQASQRAGEHGPRLGAPAVKLTLEKVAEKDVVAPPEAEVQSLLMEQQESQRLREFYLKQLLAEQEAREGGGGTSGGLDALAAAGSSTQVVDIDPWILQFLQYFQESSGFHLDRGTDLQTMGVEKLTAAMDELLTSERATELYRESIGKFQEQVAVGFYNWGSAHLGMAGKLLSDILRDDKLTRDKVKGDARYKAVEKEMKEAETIFRRAFEFCPQSWDANAGLANVTTERAKHEAGFFLAPIPMEQLKTMTPEQATEAARAQTLAALQRLTKANMDAAMPLFKQAVAECELSFNVLPQQERDKYPLSTTTPTTPTTTTAAADPPSTEAYSEAMGSQALIQLGNLKFDLSQMMAAVHEQGEWRTMLKEAIDLFVRAKCERHLIRAALKNHGQADKLADLMAYADPDHKEEAPEKKVKGGVSLPQRKDKA